MANRCRNRCSKKKGQTKIAKFSGRKNQKHDGKWCCPGTVGKKKR